MLRRSGGAFHKPLLKMRQAEIRNIPLPADRHTLHLGDADWTSFEAELNTDLAVAAGVMVPLQWLS
jgi:hypothetical protein